MPGMLVSMNVTVGDDVEQGQSLCVVEAMKMENVLRAEKKGKIKKINANQGNSLSVDEVIVEFE
jgi:propionyl-CoA carboxylase alpha chain